MGLVEFDHASGGSVNILDILLTTVQTFISLRKTVFIGMKQIFLESLNFMKKYKIMYNVRFSVYKIIRSIKI